MTENTSKYWQTSVSEIEPEHIYVRGYDLEKLIGLPFAAATYLLIRGEMPSPQQARVVDAVLSGVLDYGLEKAGTVAARAVVSSNPNMQAGLAAAVLAAGEHSLATENAARFILDHFKAFEVSGLDMSSYAKQVVAEARDKRSRIPGFGHQVFRGEDPRGQKLKSITQREGLWGGPAVLYEAIHQEFVKNPKVAHFPINDVGIMAAVSVALGFTPEESTALAVIGTLPGVAAHITEELHSGRLVRAIPAGDVDYTVSRRDFDEDASRLGWPVPDTLTSSQL
ncbi:citryl-CoA lyase [Arthrobacter sp. ISL-5]|uniref:citryl-CoA lyase n=1 Tax=Arthrobacter sp. ISL-5 TaxID=2819111 RepID=UPI001BE977FE|nr:citryl-CoA lyase [Arthrobacter sp. ISL-5]MBT2554156.1 citryl-CoA lyase [Arthrobacter sp. ISL-5]